MYGIVTKKWPHKTEISSVFETPDNKSLIVEKTNYTFYLDIFTKKTTAVLWRLELTKEWYVK